MWGLSLFIALGKSDVLSFFFFFFLEKKTQMTELS